MRRNDTRFAALAAVLVSVLVEDLRDGDDNDCVRLVHEISAWIDGFYDARLSAI